ncbi:transcriptional regulator [Hahella sp. CCB-MM4]|uniref:transcriptional regulator n=1 Tax=Hahella sp. (strain CCB-MM4) TaxID=1926491 RepID=UPI000B9A9FE5|nr:transcriptional regulator [Hahella sp. CCB-MM4]OZG74053.1 transcriptional regulator [Hahella sp. CCB-MM4]
MHIGPKFLLAAIRKKIKDEGLCYGTLSEKTGIPLSSIKRHLHNPSLGLDKILLYVSHLNTDLIELTKLAKQLQHENEQFITDEQSELFLEHPYLLDFIYMVTSRNLAPESIAEKYQLTDTSLRFYLRIAEILGYIEDSGDGIFYRSGRRFLLVEGSELDRLFRRRFQEESLSHPINPGVCVGRIRLTEAQKTQLEDDVFAKLMELDAINISNGEGKTTNVMMRCTPGKQILYSDGLPNIDGSVLKLVSAKFSNTSTA